MESVESVLKKKRKATAGRILSRGELGLFVIIVISAIV